MRYSSALLVIALILKSAPAFAELCAYDPFAKSNLSSALKGLQENSTSAQTCTFEYVKTGADIRKTLEETYPPAPASNQLFNGQFKDENPKLVKAFQDLTRGTEVIQRFHIGKDCSTVQCAAKKIWGDNVGAKMLYVKLQFGVNTSAFKSPTGDALKIFTEPEMDNLISNLEGLPSSIFPIQRNQNFPIVRVKRMDVTVGAAGKKISAAGDTDGKTNIRQFSSDAAGTSNGAGEDLFTHEIAHTVFSQKGLAFQKRWDALSHWVLKGNKWQSDRKKHFVSDYAKDENNWSADDEDFAESMAAYRHTPVKLMKCCSTKYQFLKDEIFNGEEYLSKNCLGVNDADLKRIKDELNPVKLTLSDHPLDTRKFEECALKQNSYINNPSFDSCVQLLDNSFNLATLSTLSPKDLIKRAKGLGISLNEIQAKSILDRLSSDAKQTTDSKKQAMINEAIRNVNVKLLVPEKTKMIANRASLGEVIGVQNGASPQFRDLVLSELGSLTTKRDYYLVALMSSVRQKVPSLQVSSAAGVLINDPDFKPEMDSIQKTTLEVAEKAFQLKDPAQPGLDCAKDFAGSSDEGFRTFCQTMMYTNGNHKITQEELKKFLDDRFAGIPVPDPEAPISTGAPGATGPTH